MTRSRSQTKRDAQRDIASASGGQSSGDIPSTTAPANLGGDLSRPETHGRRVVASDLAQARSPAMPHDVSPAPELNGGRGEGEAQDVPASASVNGDQVSCDPQLPTVPADAILKLYADLVEDLMGMRIATDNRKRSLIQVKGLEGSPEEKRFDEMVKALHKIEDAATRDLERAMAAHPLGGFAEQNIGVGEKSLARLLGAIGDPCSYVDRETGEIVERTVSKLWAYCGYKPGQGKYKDMEHNYNRKAKTLCFLIAESCMKNRKSPYRPVYEASRAQDEALDLPDWRKHSRALRKVSKRILKDLWKFRRGHALADTHIRAAPPDDSGRDHRLLDAHTSGVSPNGNGASATPTPTPTTAATEAP